MDLPEILRILNMPDRAEAGSSFSATLAAWVTHFNLVLESFNAYTVAVKDQLPAAIGAFPLDTAEVVIPGSTTLGSSAFGKMHVCAGSTDFTLGLPAAAGHRGELFGIRISNGYTKLVTLDGNSGELIDGAATRIMWAGESAILLCDGVGWTKIAGKSIPMVCRMQGPNTQSIPTDTYTNLLLTAAVLNIGSLADTPNNRIVIRRAGLYRICGQVSLQNVNVSTSIAVQLLSNGANLSVGNCPGVIYGMAATPGIIVPCAAPDLITIRGYHTFASAALTNTYTFLTVEEIVQW